MKKYFVVLVFALVAVFCLTGCGKEIAVSIMDNGQKTEIVAKSGQKVSKILAEAEILIGENDSVLPAIGEKIVDDGAVITIGRQANVSVIYDGETKAVEVVGGTVADAIEKAGVQLDEKDFVDRSLDDYVSNGDVITISRMVSVTLTVDGRTIEEVTDAKLVGEFLDIMKVTLGENDRVSEELEGELIDGMTIVVQRVELKQEVLEEEIAYETETKSSDKLAKGKTSVSQKGENGIKEVTYEVTYVDGAEESRTVLSENITKEPVTEIIMSGTAVAKKVVSTEYYDDCDGSGHGYKIVTYSDGTTKKINY